jgi:hypothetical protein
MNEQSQGLRTEIFADKDARTVRIEFYRDDQHYAVLEFTKSDTHKLIEGLQKACNSIGNRVKVK